MSRVLNLVLTSNEDPVEELFQLIQRNSKPTPDGGMDLEQAEVNVDIGKLHGDALESILKAGWHGVQWNWNAKQVILIAGCAHLHLRVVKPEGA